jgi:hypothetical protein
MSCTNNFEVTRINPCRYEAITITNENVGLNKLEGSDTLSDWVH